jgi:small subunit ribosomal protein S20
VAKRTKSGLKRLRQSARRGTANQAVRSRIRTLTKRVAEGNEQDVQAAIKAIDKAAARGIIHKNAAARRKSRLMRRLQAKRPA